MEGDITAPLCCPGGDGAFYADSPDFVPAFHAAFRFFDTVLLQGTVHDAYARVRRGSLDDGAPCAAVRRAFYDALDRQAARLSPLP